jgi:hypothetical protein
MLFAAIVSVQRHRLYCEIRFRGAKVTSVDPEISIVDRRVVCQDLQGQGRREMTRCAEALPEASGT